MEDVPPPPTSLGVTSRPVLGSLWTRLAGVVAGPQFDAEHVARIYSVYRVALPLYAVMTLATAGTRLHADRVMAALWGLQALTALGTWLALLWRPRQADRALRTGFCLLFLGMLLRIPRAMIASGLRDVDLHAATVGLVLALLVGQTVFAPQVARTANLACASPTFVVMTASMCCVDQLSWSLVLSGLRLMATTGLLVALLSFVTDTIRDYTRLCEEHRLTQALALCDPLTELPNRRACEATLRREIARGTREGTPLSLMMLDVDHFKSVNDRFGHEAGDRVLVRIAELLRANLRTSDEPSRWAGDEFVAVLPATSLEQARLVAERIRRAVASTDLGAGASEITVTVGVAELDAREDDLPRFLARADRNLYRAKREGRNFVAA